MISGYSTTSCPKIKQYETGNLWGRGGGSRERKREREKERKRDIYSVHLFHAGGDEPRFVIFIAANNCIAVRPRKRARGDQGITIRLDAMR